MTEPGDNAGINFIILCPQELALGKSFDPCRIDDTYGMSGIMHIGSQFISVRA